MGVSRKKIMSLGFRWSRKTLGLMSFRSHVRVTKTDSTFFKTCVFGIDLTSMCGKNLRLQLIFYTYDVFCAPIINLLSCDPHTRVFHSNLLHQENVTPLDLTVNLGDFRPGGQCSGPDMTQHSLPIDKRIPERSINVGKMRCATLFSSLVDTVAWRPSQTHKGSEESRKSCKNLMEIRSFCFPTWWNVYAPVTC